ncbi:MAG: hypothetical protein KGL39_57065 [Patescibacteria group bacterium]|nr:hypothetical protein [Patescibacteria group bacterium]
MLGVNQTATFASGTTTIDAQTGGDSIYSWQLTCGSASGGATLYHSSTATANQLGFLACPANDSRERRLVAGALIGAGALIVVCAGANAQGDVEF